MISHVLRFLPIALLCVVVGVLAFTNTEWGHYYTGWDNIHAEFDLFEYTRQIVFGAWLEHHGLGGSAGLSHLSEIFRLPILFTLTALLPDFLVRYAVIYGSLLLGGIGMYLYTSRNWVQKENKLVARNWLAAAAGMLYMLHLLTLQQFYIAFELFMVQFAFFPFFLLVIHRLYEKVNLKTAVLFVVIQFLLAPSGHTATLFYFGGVFSVIYAFFLGLNTSFRKAVFFSLGLGLATFALNAYWIVPNFYYSVENAHYVSESRDNALFGPESLWSIRHASTFPNFLAGTHYLFEWKDYNFQTGQFDFIFDDWQEHLGNPFIIVTAQMLGLLSVGGVLLILAQKKKRLRELAIVLLYLGMTIFIWIDLLPTRFLLDVLYTNSIFLEIFRNPFTKLSILFSITSVLLLVKVVEAITIWLARSSHARQHLAIALSACVMLASVVVGFQSFRGHFISEALQTEYPDQYELLFNFLKNQDRNLRLLPLPQTSQAGWEYFDWSFISPGNGYQGLGFYFAGIPQPVLYRDADRWVETSDFFYHQLQHALNSKDEAAFTAITNQYNVDLILIDETRMEPNRPIDYEVQHRFAQQAGFSSVWQQDFLTLYQRESDMAAAAFWSPSDALVVKADTDRVQEDVVYRNHGDYIYRDNNTTSVVYPFADLYATRPENISIDETGVSVTRSFSPPISGTVHVNPHANSAYLTPVDILFDDEQVQISFPSVSIILGDESIALPSLGSFVYPVEANSDQLVVVVNEQAIILERNQPAQPILRLNVDQPLSIQVIPSTDSTVITEEGNLNLPVTDDNEVYEEDVPWNAVVQGSAINVDTIDAIEARFNISPYSISIAQNPSQNCSEPQRGSIATKQEGDGYLYTADKFGVNCNGFDFEYQSTAYSYILQVIGDTVRGRGTKLFIKYRDSTVVPQSYSLHDEDYSTEVHIPAINSNNRGLFFLNWETRSFGKETQNYIAKMTLAPFPVERLADIHIVQDQETIGALSSIKEVFTRFDTLYRVDVQCEIDECLLAFDQSHDRGWFTVSSSAILQPLEHVRLNNWANAWIVEEGTHTLYVVYVPQLLAFAGYGVLIITIGVLSRQTWIEWRRDRSSLVKRAQRRFRRVMRG